MNFILFALVFLSPPFLKKILLRWFAGAKIGRHAEIGWFTGLAARHIEMGDHSAIRALTLIQLRGDFKLGAHSEISNFNLIYGSSSLIIGDASYVGPQSLINVEEPVRIGNGSALGPRSEVFTHGSFLPYNEGYWARRAGVTLGNKVWCAASVFIHPGVEIGDDTFVNSRSVVTQSIPPGSVVEGNPARVAYAMDQIKRKMTPARVDAAMAQVLRDFAEVGLRREFWLDNIDECASALRFHLRGQAYEIRLVRSNDTRVVESVGGSRQIFLMNRPDWSAPPGALFFDWRTMQTSESADRIHAALRIFMQRYYGVRFDNSR